MTRKEDVFDSMAGAYYFSCMDLMSAYYQVRMETDHIKYTAFQAPSGLYEYLVLPMGVSNAPATMHRLTSSLFKGLPHTRSFYDDIYIFTKSKDINEHLQALRDVLEIQKKNKLYVKLAKCVFCAEAIPCLGDFVGRNGVRIDPDKVQTIRDWPIPRTQEQLHSFLGLTGYVQRFCEQYAELTAPLFTLLKKKNQRNSKITLNGVQLKNIKELKRRLADTPVLHLPDFTQQMHLRTDASQFAVGGVLFQVVNCIERPIAYTSRKMKSAELKYPTQQQELLAIVNALAAFRIYCLDQPVMIETDHKSLEGVFQQKMANRRLARWYDILAEYQPVFAYLPGAQNGIADALSRRPDLKPQTKEFHDLLVPSFNETSYQLRIAEIKPTNDLVK
ncbi:Retrovirus Polyprotein, partial [Phytophthora megakarya]